MRLMLRMMAVSVGAIALLLGGVMAVARACAETAPSAWIAFSNHGDDAEENGLFTVKVVGTPVPRLLYDHPSYDISWSPDSEWLWFIDNPKGVLDIYRVRVDGSQLENLTKDRESEDELAWSPDGKHIAYLWREGYRDHLMLWSADSSDVRKLVTLTESIESLVWSPNSQWIALNVTNEFHKTNIYRVRIDGTGMQELTDFGDGFVYTEPAWTPGGEWIIFGAATEPGNMQSLAIFQVQRDGSEIRMLMNGETGWYFEGLSPDGQWMIVQRYESNSKQYRVRVDGSETHLLIPQEYFPNNNHSAMELSWSADGRWIAYRIIGGSADTAGIYTMSVDGRELRRLTDSNFDMYPVWSPPIRSACRWRLVIGMGAGLVAVGVAPWPRDTWPSRQRANHRKDRARPQSVR